MIDKDKMWLVIENKEDEKRAEQVKQLAEEIKQKENVSYETLLIEYRELKPFLHLKISNQKMAFTYLQIGKINGKKYDILSGILEINELQYKVERFEPTVTIDMQDFKPFFEKLTENIELQNDTVIEIYYGKDLPIWFAVNKSTKEFEVKKRVGVIVPKIFEPKI